MLIKDMLYGEVLINESIIKDLMNTKPFQRLKDINQYGGVNFVFPDKYQVTRFEHSIGVWHVLKTVGADFETQIAGLLHDIGHTAFSHMYDMALSSLNENHHERVQEKLVGWAEIEDILEKNSIKLKNVDEYVLIKRPLPDIGADRFDYAIRDYVTATDEKAEFADKALSDISKDDEGLFFNNLEIARTFAEIGNKSQWLVVHEPTVAAVYQSLIEMIRLGLKNGWLKEDDFLQTDEYVFNKIKSNAANIPEKYLKIFTNKYTVKEVAAKEDSDIEFKKLKSRFFNPQVITAKGKKHVSELDDGFKQSLNKSVEIFEKSKNGVYYKIEFL